MTDRDDYKFLEIRDAVASINQKVSLIGVVVEYGFPKKTRGTDCFCSIRIVDESFRKGITVNVFAEHIGALPHVASLGDIIQLSHVMMKTHGGEVNAVFNKRSSTFALYEGKGDGVFIPYQTYQKFRARELDKKFITGLRNWFIDVQIEDSDNFSLLREVKESKSFDLACKILHVHEFGQDDWIAFVWDGSDTKPNKLHTRLDNEKDHPLPLHLEPSPMSRDTINNFPPVGTVMRVVFDQGIKKHVIQLLKMNIGKWMKLVNVYCEVHNGLWRGVLTPFTKIRYTRDEDHAVSERLRLHNARLCMENGRTPYWSFPFTPAVTEVEVRDATLITLMDAINYSEVTAKFLCAVRVVAAFPWRAQDFRSPLGVYRVRLTLEDPTARIHAFLYAEDAEKFFGGYPSVDILTKKRNALLGVATSIDGKEIEGGVARDPPWVKCCIKSFYIDKNDIWGSRHFRIFGTKLIGS